MNYKPFIDTYLRDVCYSNLYTEYDDKESKLLFRAKIVIPCECNFSNKQLKVNKNKLKSFTNIYLNKYAKTKNYIEFEITIKSKTTKHDDDLYSPTIATKVLILKNYKTLYKYIKTILDCYLVSYDEITLDSEFDTIVNELSRLKA